MIAALMGRSRKRPLRKDWESVKDSIMHGAVPAKFTQHANLRETLLGTGNATGSSVLKCEAWDFSLFCRSRSFC